MPKKRGRPRIEITIKGLRQIEKLAGYGLTQAAIAAVLGMSERTFRDKKHEERVSAALDKGRAVAEANVGKALYNKAIDGDIAAIRWWEITRAGRSERQIIRHEDMPDLVFRIEADGD